MSTVVAGKLGEEKAIKLLKTQGYKIIGRNFRSRYGEIDIIATESNTLVFVEVKARWNNKFGMPEEAVTPRKLNSIIKTAEYYKLLNPKTPELLRIDVVAVSVVGNSVSAKLIKNASQ